MLGISILAVYLVFSTFKFWGLDAHTAYSRSTYGHLMGISFEDCCKLTGETVTNDDERETYNI